jgi:retinol dehydrogenase-12
MGDKICVVTGANSGIGLEIVRGLARQGETVVLVGRDERRLADARAQVQRDTGSEQLDVLLADFAALDSVRACAAAFRERYDRLDVLVNNAGLVLNRREVTRDGYEKTLQINHLAPFLLTGLLLDRVEASAPARIVNVSSDAHRAGRLDFDDLQSERSYRAFRVYGTTKLCNVLFTIELARRLEGSGVTANAVHPGFVRTNFGRNNAGPYRASIKLLQNLVALSPQQGAQTPLYVATSPEVEAVTGRYFVKCQVQVPAGAARDAETARRLWAVSEQLTGLTVG